MMKKLLLVLIALGFVGQTWGQNNKKCVDTIPQYKTITNVKISNDTLKVQGFLNSNDKDYYDENCKKIDSSTFVYINKTTDLATFSLITIPIKIRPKTENIPSNVDSGLDNVGVNFELISRQWDKYFVTGRNSTHRISGGLMLAPLVQELTKDNTKSKTGNSKQFFISTGLTFNYSYNKILFTIVPIGFDFASNQTGKDWVNNGNYWWGFGIGADLKILESMFDK